MSDNLPAAFTPRDPATALVIATELSKSGMVPKDYVGKPGAIFAAMEMGSRLGLSAMQACQSIAVINGRPSLWGDGALGVVQSHPAFAGIDEDGPAQALAAKRGRCKLKRLVHGVVNECERTFSVQDATTAGLIGKAGPWTQYPGRMLQMRARSLAMRDLFSDALKGLTIVEEAQDIVETTATVVDMMPREKPKEDAAPAVVDAQPAASFTPPPREEPRKIPDNAERVRVKIGPTTVAKGSKEGREWTRWDVSLTDKHGTFIAGTFSDTLGPEMMSANGMEGVAVITKNANPQLNPRLVAMEPVASDDVPF